MVKKKIKDLITNSGSLLQLLNMVAEDFPRVFVWHRFSAPTKDVNGCVSADVFGWQLDQIRQDFQVLTLGEVLKHYLEHRQWPRRCVVLTVDDGYRDFYLWAYPELKKREMQATFFTTVNFVEGIIWLWPDRLQWALDESSAEEVALPFHGELRQFPLKTLHDKASAWKSCSDYCITLADDKKEMFIRAVMDALQVSCPEKPTDEYHAVSWDELLEMSNSGIEIGSHTMNHPILSRIDQTRLVEEVCTPKKILEDKLGRGITSFCYPNSAPGDITDKVVETVQKAGYSGAVLALISSHGTPTRFRE